MHKLMIKRELNNAVIKVKTLDKIAFPDVKLPFPITNSLLGIVTWNVPASLTEHDMAPWLNGIIAQIATYTGVQAHRK